MKTSITTPAPFSPCAAAAVGTMATYGPCSAQAGNVKNLLKNVIKNPE